MEQEETDHTQLTTPTQTSLHDDPNTKHNPDTHPHNQPKHTRTDPLTHLRTKHRPLHQLQPNQETTLPTTATSKSATTTPATTGTATTGNELLVDGNSHDQGAGHYEAALKWLFRDDVSSSNKDGHYAGGSDNEQPVPEEFILRGYAATTETDNLSDTEGPEEGNQTNNQGEVRPSNG